ncbi:MAG: sigma-70 family RNA polymerase sigma factor [Planctomycetota bacterium]
MIRPAEQCDLEMLIAEHGPSVFAVCRRTTRDIDSALDAFQDTFVAFTARWDSLDHESDLGPWLRETARRCALARARGTARAYAAELPTEHPALALRDRSGLDQLIAEDNARVLREEFGCLDPKDQQLLYLAFVEELGHREIARHIGCPSGSMHAKLRAARSRLQSRLKKRGLVAGLLLLLLLFQKSKKTLAADVASPLSASSSPRPLESSAGEAKSAFTGDLMRWPVVFAMILLVGGLSAAACYTFQPGSQLETWSVPLPAASESVGRTGESTPAARQSFARGPLDRSGAPELVKCDTL